MSENESYGHIPVMLAEVLDLLAPRTGDTAVDGTVGFGGHSRRIGELIGKTGRLCCFDKDTDALARAAKVLAGLDCTTFFINSSFDVMEQKLSEIGTLQADRILMDLGVSSLQLDKPERGFSFRHDGPLDMRMDPAAGVPASHVVNTWPEEKLADLFYSLGEERFSRRIAKKIVVSRAERPISTTGELSTLVGKVVPGRGRIHPATRVFQALRMQVNDELGTLSRGLAAAGKILTPGGRLAVITFHSLEDRLVKRTFLKWKELGLAILVNAKAVSCSRDEARNNRRARSAKLRVVERTG